jgi:hypothetical protein
MQAQQQEGRGNEQVGTTVVEHSRSIHISPVPLGLRQQQPQQHPQQKQKQQKQQPH